MAREVWSLAIPNISFLWHIIRDEIHHQSGLNCSSCSNLIEV